MTSAQSTALYSWGISSQDEKFAPLANAIIGAQNEAAPLRATIAQLADGNFLAQYSIDSLSAQINAIYEKYNVVALYKSLS